MGKTVFDVPWIELRNGVKLPPIGLGCAQLEDYGQQDELIRKAFDAGYRLFDTATLYGNEELLGNAYKNAGLPRDQILVSTKLYGNSQGYDNAMRGFEASLKALQVDYLDLYLIHWPSPVEAENLGSWKAFETLYEQGMIRAIGLSNYKAKDLEVILQHCNIAPFFVQLEFNPYFNSKADREFCAQHGIAVEGYFPLGGQVVGAKGIRQPPPEVQMFDHPVIKAIAEKMGKTTAQIILRWEIQSNVIPLPKTTKAARLIENISLFDFELTAEDMAAIDALNFDYHIGPKEGETNKLSDE